MIFLILWPIMFVVAVVIAVVYVFWRRPIEIRWLSPLKKWALASVTMGFIFAAVKLSGNYVFPGHGVLDHFHSGWLLSWPLLLGVYLVFGFVYCFRGVRKAMQNRHPK